MMDITKEGILFPKWSDRIGNITAPRTPATTKTAPTIPASKEDIPLGSKISWKD